MTELSPTYYAAGEDILYVESLTGKYFGLIPDNAVGVMSEINDNPLKNRYTNNNIILLTISQKTDSEMTLTASESATHEVPFYLGAILSEDRSVVYWVNDTKPLP